TPAGHSAGETSSSRPLAAITCTRVTADRPCSAWQRAIARIRVSGRVARSVIRRTLAVLLLVLLLLLYRSKISVQVWGGVGELDSNFKNSRVTWGAGARVASC